MRLPIPTTLRIRVVLFAGVLAASVFGLRSNAVTVSAGQAIKCAPVRLEDVQAYVSVKAPVAVVRRRIAECGLGFILDTAGEKVLRGLGASDALLALVLPPPGAKGARWTTPIDHREMLWVEAGTFEMGSPAGEAGHRDTEAPHRVTIASGFWLDAFEVTNDDYKSFVAANPRWQKGQPEARLADANYLETWNGNDYPAGEGKRPVVHVSWAAARAYAAWAGKRLPTEAEWEFAARAGTRTAYWWGDVFDRARANDGIASLPVDSGQARANAWGFHDLLGNVAEWTSSSFTAYPYRADDGRENPESGGARTVRGGAWGQGPRELRSAYRAGVPVDATTDAIGFRCAR